MSNDAFLRRFIERAGLPTHFAASARRCWLPLADWLGRQAAVARPFVAGLNGAQGSGKTTLANFLADCLGQRGLRVAVLSLDDFYHTRAKRRQLARDKHALLETRGVPGTHDIAWLSRTIEALRDCERRTPVRWPRFDKANDDRDKTLQHFTGVADLVLLEGWCVGTAAESDVDLLEPCNDLERTEDPDGRWRRIVNTYLGDEYQRVFTGLDGLCFLRVPGMAEVRRWRLQQERSLASAGPHPALMDEARLNRFIMHFERLTRVALRTLPGRADWTLALDERHRCVQAQPRCRSR